ncbi:class I SAM-dependent methyltransferase [Prodigiosinella confusarubida]|uniref:Class I SAM-dependent methyltransferase n=1 Tax=Serratia sp. (strain ATCC 39006) TaxID=104623 RepID=A0A2I5T948_SERS3|nr:class I SAM-dependent methyltransferase [Serratia sp. ATCC 39006]AUH01099.1 class I SAM-dependent methyltransferase [Serratia sp. ATCC 39006]AUH05420.1 class I SAM-dependent methyltransferase [Serratia sp. ATCC 39006]
MWNEKYANEQFVYGTEPNDFLKKSSHHFVPGSRILCIAEGEGRNAVWLASQGFDVTAVDASDVGLAKGKKRAEANGLKIQWIHADLATYDIGRQQWGGIVAIFAHLPPTLRHQVHGNCASGLQSSGVFLLEAYTPEQLKFKTGGPSDITWLMTPETLRQELPGLRFAHLQKLEREIHEGIAHTGHASVVQLIARRD